MGVRFISDAASFETAMYDSVTGIAFGPVFSCYDEAVEFVKWLKVDARSLTHKDLMAKYKEFYALSRDENGDYIGIST
jgi:hypothetical protein